jgi:putative nucleotidyltransferase with HDIG domain
MPTTSEPSVHAQVPLALVEVPPFPAVAIRALQMVTSEFGRFRELSDLVSADPAFSSEILRVANSPLWGINYEVKSILQALLLLGLERTKGIVLTIGIRAYLADALQVPAFLACWRHSLACALVAEELARASRAEPDSAYTAGLIHDIGRLALAVIHREAYSDFLKNTDGAPGDVLQRERDQFGIDHCEAGESLVMRWNLPRSFADITSRHHRPPREGCFDLIEVVHLACQMADALGFEAAHHPDAPPYVEILARVPESGRDLLPADRNEFAFRVAAIINSIELS